MGNCSISANKRIVLLFTRGEERRGEKRREEIEGEVKWCREEREQDDFSYGIGKTTRQTQYANEVFSSDAVSIFRIEEVPSRTGIGTWRWYLEDGYSKMLVYPTFDLACVGIVMNLTTDVSCVVICCVWDETHSKCFFVYHLEQQV